MQTNTNTTTIAAPGRGRTKAVAMVAAVSVLVLGAGTASAAGVGIKLGVSKPKAGATAVTIDPATAAALGGLGVSVGATAPATTTADGVSLPITGGSLVYAKVKRQGKVIQRNLGGSVTHSGAVTFTKDATTVSLSNLRVQLTAHKDGVVQANVNGSRARVNVLRLVMPKVDATDRSITATVKLTRESAAALNSAFSTTALSTATTVGTVKITPTF